MIVQSPTPSARAARTYSKLRARRNSARTTLTSAVHWNSASRTSIDQKVGSMIAAMIMIRNRVGIADQISSTRWKVRSTQPPK